MTAFKLIQGLTQTLFEPDHRRLDQTIIRLNQKNKQLKQHGIDGFIHQGKRYIPKLETITTVGPGTPWPTLHESLVPEMQLHLKDVASVENDKMLISQMISRLIKPCKTYQEIRDALPECLIKCLPQLKTYTRTREPAYTLLGDERSLRQYEKLLSKIEMYSVAGFIY